MSQNYIGNNGIVVQNLTEIKEDLIAKYKTIYGADINLEQNSPDGQFINILAQEKKDILDFCVQLYNNLDTDRVVGIPQQILYKLNGLTIKAFTYSYVYVDVTVTAPVNIEGITNENLENADAVGYTVSDSNGNRWILATGTSSSTVSLTTGTHTLNFRATDLGSITALPNTITTMETVIAGISGVNNAANNYVTGGVGETDAEFRIRRNRSVTIPSQGFDDGLEAQLLNLTNVTQAKVYQNRTNSTDANNIPAHAVWVIVEGGSADDIGKTIYANIPPGIKMHGSESVQVERAIPGTFETVYYDLGAAEDLYIEATIKVISGSIDESYVKEELSKLTWNIAESVEAVNIATAIKDLIGDVGTPYDVGVSLTGTAGSYSEIVTPTALNGYFTLSTSNIDLSVVNA